MIFNSNDIHKISFEGDTVTIWSNWTRFNMSWKEFTECEVV